MYLKRLEMQGFKSFADKLILDFGPGITTVVGPNGSGKSNISDAVRWVLGEQSAKTLRGGKMEDVIFVGTQSRRPVGFAEVSLVIDNQEGILPIEFNEVKVTRRLYRSGESEYMINMATCRLKDIEQLFFDTGIGVDGYSIIGQGQVDSILSGKVDERRAIFEEASGIMKYKVRKTEAERKLVLTTQNMERITDIVAELENQVNPLSEQAEIAKKYLALRDELKDYEISIYVDSITKYTRQKEEIAEKDAIIKNDIDSQTVALENIKQSNEEKNLEYKKVEEQLEEIRNKYYENERQLAGHGADMKVSEGKIKAIEENNTRLSAETEEEQKSIFQIEEELKGITGEISRLNADKEEADLKLRELEEKNLAIMNLMSERVKHVETLREQLALKNKEHSDVSGKVSVMNQIIASNSLRKGEIEREKDNLNSELTEIEQIRKTSEEAGAEFLNKSEQLNKEKSKFVNIKEQNEEKLRELKEEALKLSSEYQFKTSRLSLLSEMDEKMEGYQRSVKEIISSANKQAFVKGIRGTVASLIETEKQYELAIETALGQAFQYIIADTEGTAKDAIEYLRKNSLGRATFLPMTAINGKTLEKDVIARLKKMSGFVGLGHEIIKYNKEYHNVMLSQLGKVAIAEDLDCAILIAREFKYNFKIITLKGDIIRPSGAMTGGSVEKAASSGIIGRRREIEELTERTSELSRIVKKMNDEAVECTVKISNSGAEAGKIDSELRGIEIKLVEINSVMQRLEERLQNIYSKAQRLDNDIVKILKETERTQAEVEDIEKAIEALEGDMGALKNEIDLAEASNSTGRAAVDAMKDQLTEKKLYVNGIVHRLETASENHNRIGQTLIQYQRSIEIKGKEILDNEKIIAELVTANKLIEEKIRAFTESQADGSGLMEKVSFEKQTLSDELLGMTNKIADISKNIYMLQEEYNRIEVRKTKIVADEENCRNKLWEDYEITPVNASEYIVGKELGSVTSMQKYITELRTQIRELGNVNVNAIEDYKNTKERLEFLTVQLGDLEESKGKLEKIIHDMSIIMKKQFIEHFELINQSFNSVFRELFDGGRANVLITDQNNVLESPIEIEVQPPGKKLQNMMLLSGGEKALTAIALLFAVLKLKPTPFCILDEIEAALDDTNVIRFAEYITNFSNNTQFVLITHRKGTMEAADVIYGVTMEERGVSKIVSLRLE